MSASGTLSYRCSQFLASLDRVVGGSGSAATWLEALSTMDRPYLELWDDSLSHEELADPAVTRSIGRGRALTRADVESLTLQQAARQSATKASIAHLVAALMLTAGDERDAPPPLPADHPVSGNGAPPVAFVGAPRVPRPERGLARTFRVFISSTFLDFAPERDVLQRVTWPRLRAYCADRNARFQAIDLRWGIRPSAMWAQRAVDICLDEVERCQRVTRRPNFIALVGERYGSPTVPSRITAHDWDLLHAAIPPGSSAGLLHHWYELDVNAVPPEYVLRPKSNQGGGDLPWDAVMRRLQEILATALRTAHLTSAEREAMRLRYLASATEQEIVRGVLTAEGSGAAVVVFRDIVRSGDALDDLQTLRAWVDDNETDIRNLRSRLTAAVDPSMLVTEAIPWGPDGPDIKSGYLDKVADRVGDLLEYQISEELTHPSTPPAPTGGGDLNDPFLDNDGRAHRSFGGERTRHFTGRTTERSAIAQYLNTGPAAPLLVEGGGGVGKTAFMAMAAQDARVAGDTGSIVVERYIGATAESADPRTLLRGICLELARRCGEPESDVPTTYVELARDFLNRLRTGRPGRKIVVFVDSLDQLQTLTSTSGFPWVPSHLPEHCALVLSARADVELEVLRTRVQTVSLTGLKGDDGELLITQWLDAGGRTLQPAQAGHVIENFQGSGANVLYLAMAFQEVREWRSGDGQPPQALPVGLRRLITHLFERLEGRHGVQLVERTFACIVSARHGVAEDELVDLLSADVDVYLAFLADAKYAPPDLADRVPDCGRFLGAGSASSHEVRALLKPIVYPADGPKLPIAVWSRLLFDLGPYLANRPSPAGGLLASYHREFDDAARLRYTQGPAFNAAHRRLADYFSRQEIGRRDARALSELTYHLVRCGAWDKVVATLTDVRFLERSIALRISSSDTIEEPGAGIHPLLTDFEDALAQMPNDP